MKKRIVIVSPVGLFPTIMASQDRIINIALRLSLVHFVDVILPFYNEEEKEIAQTKMAELSGKLIFIRFPNYNLYRRRILGLYRILLKQFRPVIDEIYYPTWPSVLKEIISHLHNGKYDIVQLEYWYQGKLFDRLPVSTMKVVDTHNVLFEKRELEKEVLSNKKWTEKLIKKYKYDEIRTYTKANLLISISQPDIEFFKSTFPNKQHILISTGQNISKYLTFDIKYKKENIILFYGSMGGDQNIHAFWRLYNKIFPLIKNKVPDAQLLVVGANPPDLIKALDSNKDVKVTGYVDDLPKILSEAKLMILPMEIAGGFRSRVIEVMSLGIPIIGTHNALDNIGTENKRENFILDLDQEMADAAVYLLQNEKSRIEMGKLSREFCSKSFSFDNTYDKLAEFYNRI